MDLPLALAPGDIALWVLDVFLLLQWGIPVLPVACAVLGYFIARKTFRGKFNWVIIGFIAGVIPVMGPVLMVLAWFFMVPPLSAPGPGYHPPKTRESQNRRR